MGRRCSKALRQTPLAPGDLSRTAVLFLELTHAPGGINDLLLAGVKRMASGADLNVKFFAQGRPGLKTVATGTHHFNRVVSRMNFWLHDL